MTVTQTTNNMAMAWRSFAPLVRRGAAQWRRGATVTAVPLGGEARFAGIPAVPPSACHLGTARLLSTQAAGTQEGRSKTAEVLAREEEARNALERWGGLLNLLGYNSEEAEQGRESEALFGAVLEQATHRGVAQAFGVQDAFRAEHALIVMHAWCVHAALVADGSVEGKKLQEAMFDRCWEQTVLMIRSLDVPEVTVNKHLKELQKVSFGAMVSYDTGLAEGGTEELAGALYRNLYGRDERVSEEHVLALADYAVRQRAAVAATPLDEMAEGRVRWAAVDPAGAALAEGDAPPSEWRKALDSRGRIYWWHTESQEVKWDEAVVF